MRLLALVLAAAILAAPAARAQDEPGAGEPAPAASGSDSFAGQFFMSWNVDPRTGEKSLEIIGSLMIWVILLLSLVSFALMVNLVLVNQRKTILPAAVVEEIRRLMAAGRYRDALELTGRDPSFFSQVLRAALQEASHGFGAVVRSLELTAEELTTIRFRRTEYLNVVAQMSPMLGLLGTVYGMILAFTMIVKAGGNADPVLLAGGIGTALVTTFWGLIVAIPALAAYALIRNRIDELTTEATRRAEELVNQFRPKPRPRAPAAEPAAAAPPR